MTRLEDIQQLQFTDRAAAEAMLIPFLREVFPLDVQSVTLRPLAVSLNSFNGVITLADGTRLFFKSHVEADNQIDEYYNSALLAEAGYPVIQPLYTSSERGRQILIYELIEAPSVFDVAWAIENGGEGLESLTAAQHHTDDRLLEIYLNMFQPQGAEDAAAAPVHQLFYHRLTGGRLARFYADDVPIRLPDLQTTMAEVKAVRWIINGQRYDETLNDLITAAIRLLEPKQAGISIVGHGDAHNGNVFYHGADQPLQYFDPAFAGRHHPLLDLTKPLFHNVFAMWMYFPREIDAKLPIALPRDGETWRVNYDYPLPPVREMFFTSKIERVLKPTLQALNASGSLHDDWRAYLKAALMCCPLLTMNLTDSNKFPPAISLLGLAMAVEMGGESRDQRSRIDQALDEVERTL